MNPARPFILLAAAASMLALAACNDNSSSRPPPSDDYGVTPQDQPAEEPEEQQEQSSTDEALQRIREAAEATGQAVRDEAQRLGERGRQALEDAQPALERASEWAGQFGQSLNEIAQQALRDFESGVAELQRRIDQADDGDGEPPTGDPAARLGPADQLRTDTRAAAEARPAGVGPDYVGVWATDAASCGRIDREAVENFAVITTTTIRRSEAVCNFEAEEMVGSNVVLDAQCIAEGDLEDRAIAIEMPSEDRLRIGTPEAPGSVDLVRCSLAE